MTKVTQRDSKFGELLQYLNGSKHLGLGHELTPTLVGQKMCPYCRNSLRDDKMPRTSIANNFDTGVAPTIVQQLNPFELMLLRRVNMFQSTVVLGPTAGHLKRSEKMKAMKGFCVHIPMPLDNTISQLKNLRPGELVKPENTIQVLGVPNKNKFVWNQLVDVQKLYKALEVLIEINPQYADITLPSSPDELLPKFDLDPTQSIKGSQDVIDFLNDLAKSSSNSDGSLPVLFNSESDESFITLDECSDSAESEHPSSVMNDSLLSSVYSSQEDVLPSNLSVVSELGSDVSPSNITQEDVLPSNLSVVSELGSNVSPSNITQEDVLPSNLTVISELGNDQGSDPLSHSSRTGGLADSTEFRKELLGRRVLQLLRLIGAQETVCNICLDGLSTHRLHLLRLGTILLTEQSLRKRISELESILESLQKPLIPPKSKTCCSLCQHFIGKRISKSKKVKKNPQLQEQNMIVFSKLMEARTTLMTVVDTLTLCNIVCGRCNKTTVKSSRKGKRVGPLSTAASKIYKKLGRAEKVISQTVESSANEVAEEGACIKCSRIINDTCLVEVYPELQPWTLTSAVSWEDSYRQHVGLGLSNEVKPEIEKNKVILREMIASWRSSNIERSVCGERCRQNLGRLITHLAYLHNGFLFKPEFLEHKVLQSMHENITSKSSELLTYCVVCSYLPSTDGQMRSGAAGDETDDSHSEPNVKDEYASISDFSSLSSTSSVSSQPKGTSNPDKAKKLLRKLGPNDLKNRIEEMTFSNIDAILESDLDNLYELLKVQSTPVPSSDKRLELLSFPELFCHGTGSLHDDRPQEMKCGPAKYSKTRLLSGDARFRHNLQYVFYLAGEQMRRKIAQSIYGALRNVHGLDQLTSGELLNKIKSNDDVIKRRISASLRDVPGTKQYWASVKSKLRAQTEKHGPPTFFVTFSPAEYDWPELIGMLRDLNKDLPGVDSMSDSELLNKEPALTAQFIHTKFQALLEFIKTAEPLGKVKSHFVRYEYQGRGTVHFHCLFWIKDAPVIGESTEEEVSTFIQERITCRLPDKTLEPTLHRIVKKYQLHSCRKYCLRSVKALGKGRKRRRFTMACRFGFPLQGSSKFHLRDVMSSLVGRFRRKFKKRLYDLPRTREERNINAYNPACSLLWGGNMDIQFMSENSFSICEYVCKYILKEEVSNINCDFSKVADTSGTAFQRYSKFAYAFLKQREMSANEAVDIMLLTGGDLWTSSEKYVWVPTTLPEKRSRTLKKISELEKDASSKELFHPDFLHDYYPNRAKEEDNNLNLFRFVSKYERDYSKKGRKLKKRKNEPVVYHHHHNIKKEPELFYYSMLSLYKPWRKESDIMGKSKSYQEEFLRCSDDPSSDFDDLRSFSGKKLDIEKVRAEMLSKVNDAMEAENKKDNKESNANLSTAANSEDGEDNDQSQGVNGALDNYQQSSGQGAIKTQEDLDAYVSTLNKEQLEAYNKVTAAIEHMSDHRNGLCKDKTCTGQVLLFISGFGGTGKSYLIAALSGYCYVQREVHKRDTGLLLMAPTGVAALNIFGVTIHAALDIPVEHGQTPKYTSYKGEKLHRTRQVLSDLDLVIIDEVSMVSNVLLFYVSLRLSEIFKGKQGGDAPFGGRCVVLFGDLLQLQPVQAAYPFVEISSEKIQKLTGGVPFAQNLWRLFDYTELKINQRQKTSAAHGQEWKELLSRLRVGGLTAEDVKLLGTRLINLKETQNPQESKVAIINYYKELVKHDPRAVCLLPTKAMVGEFNESMLESNVSKTVNIPAIDDIQPCIPSKRQRIEQAIKKLDKLDDSRNTAALEQLLIVAENVRVMLRRNIDLGKGLVNGSMGTIVKIHHDPASQIVNKISIKFDNIDEIQHILRDRREIMVFSGGFFFRSQFPITLSYSITIHKAQGLTLDTVLTDVGNRLFAPGQMYVCLSRVRSLAGLHLINFSPKKAVANVSALKEYVRLGSNREYMPKAPTSVLKVGKTPKQRLWWTNKDAVGKAKAAITNVVLDTIDKKSTRPVKKAIKKPKRSTTGRADGPDAIKKIVSLARRSRNPNFDLEFISEAEINTLYADWIYPGLSGALDFDHNKVVEQLNPDPFNSVRPRDKWLSDITIQQYMWLIADRVECNNPGYTFHSMAACFDNFRHPYHVEGKQIQALPLSQLTDTHFRDIIVPSYANQAYVFPRWSTRHIFRGSRQHRIIEEGDPMDNDIIALVGNPSGNHWVLVIIDNRPSPKAVLYFDSGSYQGHDVTDRCIHYMKALQFYREYISTLGVQLNPATINLQTHSIRDGGSVKQVGNFDCGIFVLANLELYLAALPTSTITPGKLPLLRASILAKLLDFEGRKL
eukprot:sb/3460501/